MKYVFIDTNVFLNFYSFSKDHLDKLKILVHLIKESKIKLILPRQVIDEFNRNREGKLKETLDYLDSFKTRFRSPTTCHDFSEMKEIQKKIDKSRELSVKVKTKLLKQINEKTLSADKLISDIFSISDIKDISDELFNRAKRRFDLGNPPGKNKSYGDAINWVCCLEVVPEKESLYLIAGDNDYVSKINPNNLSDFLKDEWKNQKKSEIYYSQLISEFLKENFPETKIGDTEIKEEREVVDESLANRDLSSIPKDLGSFMETQEYFKSREENLKKLASFRAVPAYLKYQEKYLKHQEENLKKLASFRAVPAYLKHQEEYLKHQKENLKKLTSFTAVPAYLKHQEEYLKHQEKNLKKLKKLTSFTAVPAYLKHQEETRKEIPTFSEQPEFPKRFEEKRSPKKDSKKPKSAK